MSEATPEDRLEQQAMPSGQTAPVPTPEVPLEAPSADAAEQAAGVDEDADGPQAPLDLPLEADPADAAEQASVVELDEDERR